MADDAPATPRDTLPPFQLVENGDPLPPALRRPVLAIGNFDGLHRGHQVVIAAARTLAGSLGRPAAVLTFEPHPRSFFAPDKPLFRLTPPAAKAAILARMQLAGALVLAFDSALAATSASAFADELLLARFKASGIVVGQDFHFGKGRAGSSAFLEAWGRENHVPVRVVAPVALPCAAADGPVSSSLVRAALAEGDIAGANRLLGYRWFVRGEVLHGDKRGRTLGFPTANLAPGSGCRLRHGIYAVRARLGGQMDGQRGGPLHDGVASFGRRPTFDDGEPRLEVHLFDFSASLYGRQLDVEFIGWIRGEERFDSVEALVARMDMDCAAARAMLASPGQIGEAPSMIGAPAAGPMAGRPCNA